MTPDPNDEEPDGADEIDEPDEDEEASEGSGAYESILDGPDRLVAAATQLTTLTGWVRTTVIGAGGAVLAATPLLTGFEYETEWSTVCRSLLAMTAAVVAAVGVILVIGALVHREYPVVVSLDSLPPSFRAKLTTQAASYLPDNPNGLTEGEKIDDALTTFRNQLRSWRRAADGALTQAQRDPDNTELKVGAEWAQRQADIYIRARDVILLEAGIDAKLEQARSKKGELGLGVAMVAAGLVLYIILLSGKPPEKEDPPAGPTAAVLIPDEGGPLRGLLDACKQPISGTVTLDAEGKVNPADPIDGIPVLLTGGKGTGDEPWEVQTFGIGPNCPAMSFTLTQGDRLLKLDASEVKPEAEDDGDDQEPGDADSGDSTTTTPE